MADKSVLVSEFGTISDLAKEWRHGHGPTNVGAMAKMQDKNIRKA